MNQKLAYMHANPCTGKWMLCQSPIDYEHSSARHYISGSHARYQVTDIEEILKTILGNTAETTASIQADK